MTAWTLAQAGMLAYPATVVAGLAAMGVPVAIHMLTRMRRRPQPWGAMRLLFEIHRRHRHRVRFEQILLLAVRCLILAVLGLALGGPVLAGGAGAWGAWLMGTAAGEPGRLVCLVIDDSLSTQATDPSGRSRFDRLQETALELIDGLNPEDRLAVWRCARPARVVHALGAFSPDGARRAIRSIKPRYSRSDLINTLSLVDTTLAQHAHPLDRTFVVLLSDFARDALPIDQPVSRELVKLGDRATLLVPRPEHGAPNVQVAELMPRHSLILPPPAGLKPTLPIRIRLERFAGDAQRELTNIELAVFAGDGPDPITVTQRQHRWLPGQNKAVIQVHVPLEVGPPRSRDGVSGGVGVSGVSEVLSIRARLQPTDAVMTNDALQADDERWAVVEYRSRLRVGVVSGRGGHGVAGGLTPEHWVRLALQPDALMAATADRTTVGEGAIEVVLLEAVGLNDQTIKALDAVLVLRPDFLDSRGWASLKGFVQRGGLVWLFVPPNDSPAVWGMALRERFGLDWQVGLEPQGSGPDSQPGEPLDVDSPVPEPLALLGADWQALLRPIRVSKRLVLNVQGAEDSTRGVWLRMSNGEPLLISGRVGAGRVLLLGTAIDPGWTNLPAKPLFVPLLHETIRGVLGSPAVNDRLNAAVVCGDHPTLGWGWEGAKEMVLAGSVGEGVDPIGLRETDSGVVPVSALENPGVYTAIPVSANQAVAVNPDASGGDTSAVEPEQIGAWLSGLGKWQWLEQTDPAAALVVGQQQLALGWFLLWVVLGLVVIELFLARWFSHAADRRLGWVDRVKTIWRSNKPRLETQRGGL